MLRDFAELLELPNVTGSVEDLRLNANELVRRFEIRGASMEVVELPGASPDGAEAALFRYTAPPQSQPNGSLGPIY